MCQMMIFRSKRNKNSITAVQARRRGALEEKMSKEEKKIYAICYPIMIAFAVFIVYVAISDKKAAEMALDDESVYFIEEEAETEIRPVITLQSGMPCENPEQFERWLKEYEQTASEEKMHYPKRVRKPSILEVEEITNYSDSVSDAQSGAEVETESEEYSETPEISDTEETSQRFYKYEIVGTRIDADLQERLFMALDEARIPYWYEIAVCQLFQESRGERYAVSKDGKDHGIFQYRLQYWDSVCSQYGFSGASIYDTDVQIKIYATQMANRLNHGLSVDEVISRHKTSDEVSWVDTEYVNQVKQWLNKMEVCK